ncbi:efflux RND transporter periplasmic adaptor subunit [Hydrogenimonas sp.]
MKRKITSLLLAAATLFAADISIDEAVEKPFGKRLHTNAKIVQLSNQRQQIVSRLGGHLEAYYVEPGATVRKGAKIAKVHSLELSKMTAEYLGLGKKIEAARERLASTKRLFEKGLASRQDLNREQIALATIESARNSLASQLESLGIDPARLKEATDTLVIRAHSDGVVSRLLVPLHTNLGAETPIVSLVRKSGYYAIAYISVEEALKIPKEVRGELRIGDETFDCRYLYLLPKVDEETQRAQMLFWIESSDRPLLLNAFAEMEIDLPPLRRFVAVKRSALTMFAGEWVLFTPTGAETAHSEHDEAERDDHGGHRDHDDHEAHGDHDHDHDESGKEEEHDEHDGHDDHEAHGEAGDHEDEGHHDEAPYEPRVVTVITTFGEYAAVKGIEAGERYVSDGVYFVKSMLLKSELGGHGH